MLTWLYKILYLLVKDLIFVFPERLVCPIQRFVYLENDLTRMIVLLNEGARPGWNGLYHYYHFAAEDLLGATTAYAAVEPAISQPERVVIPWSMAWRDKWGLNEFIVEGMFEKRSSLSSPSLQARNKKITETRWLILVAVVEEDQWNRLTGDSNWVLFEKGESSLLCVRNLDAESDMSSCIYRSMGLT